MANPEYMQNRVDNIITLRTIEEGFNLHPHQSVLMNIEEEQEKKSLNKRNKNIFI